MKEIAWNARVAIVAFIGLLALAVVTTLSVTDSRAQPPGVAQPAAVARQPAVPAPVVDAKGLMNLFNKPLFMHLKQEMAQQPANNEAWASLEQRGLQAAEVANLVAMRQARPPQEQWIAASANLQAAGIAFADAAKSRNWEATVQAYQGLVQRCNDCHRARAPDTAPMLK